MIITPNSKQQECIDNIDGKYLVLAGPGTGKTFTMIQRIKNMIEKGINPEKILCLTFSDAATNEVKTRLEKELGKLDVGVNVYTYHGFCNEIILENTIDFELSDNIKVIPDAVSISLIKECIDEIDSKIYRTKRNDPYYFIKEIRDNIKEIKINRLTKEKFFHNIETNPDWEPKLVELQKKLAELNENNKKVPKKLLNDIDAIEKKITKVKEIWKFYELYKSKMEEQRYFDFSDMINLVLEKFETDSAFLSKTANKYEYILVDEYQDTNKNQNEIVFHLTKALESENVFVVGDDDQIIYTFQGAKIDHVERFLKEFPDTKVICLKENMRSTQNILDTARKIVEQDDKRLEINPEFAQYNIDKHLVSKNTKLPFKDRKVRFYHYADILQEYQEIVDEIVNLIESDDCPKDDSGNKKLSEIAILTRDNNSLATFAEMLKEKNIPSELKEGKSIFQIISSNILYYYMQLLINPELHSDKFFRLALSQPFNIHPKDFETIYNQKSHYKSFVEMMNSIDKKELIEPEKIDNFINIFNHLLSYKTNETLKNVVLEIGCKTGIFDYYINSETNRIENISGLKKIVDEAVNFSNTQKKISLEEFVEYLTMCFTDEIPIKIDKSPVAMNAVQLSTYHSAKGREFEYVYMPTLKNRDWESSSKSLRPIVPLDASEYKTDEELRELKKSDCIKLLYVGMTRAKHTLRLSYPKNINGSTQTPTKFISSIEDVFEIEQEPFTYDSSTFLLGNIKALRKLDYDYEKDFCSMVDKKLEGKSFSPSAVNTYLKCPRQYFYNYILDLSPKDGNPDPLSFGKAVHSACEFAVRFAKLNNEYPTKVEFINEFKKALDKLPMSSYKQREIHIERGEKALSEYYIQMCNTPSSMLYEVEKPINFELDGIKFYGIIDRIDKNSDGTYTIYDYKTGGAKDSKIICPDGKHEDYYNQMGLYKYYFEKSTGNTVKETIFIFPEEFTDNFTLNLTQDDCKAIDAKFKEAISNIKNYKFNPTPSNEICKYCPYKDFC